MNKIKFFIKLLLAIIHVVRHHVIIMKSLIIDLNAKRYNIKQSNFNIRKPTNDQYNLFSDIVNNIDNPDYYFINNNNSNNIKTDESDIYFIPEDIIIQMILKK